MPKGWFGDSQAHSLAAKGIRSRASMKTSNMLQPKARPISVQPTVARPMKEVIRNLQTELYRLYNGEPPLEIKNEEIIKVTTDQGKFDITRFDLEQYYKYQISSSATTKQLGKITGSAPLIDEIAEEVNYVFNRISEEQGG